MNRSHSSTIFVISHNFFFISTIFLFIESFARRPFARSRAEEQMTAGYYCGLATHTPIRAHLNDGTSSLMRAKAPILRDVIFANANSHFTNWDPLAYPANHPYP